MSKIKILFIVSLFSSITSCKEESNSLITKNTNNTIKFESTYKTIEFEADESLKNYIPASKVEIHRVQTTADSYKIKYGYSFGECVGFCKSTIELSSKGILKTQYRWRDKKTIISYHSIDTDTYDSLMSTINFSNFLDFDENLGCGDCADGGAEWIEIKKEDNSKKISGTFGFKLKPVQSILDYLKSIKNI